MGLLNFALSILGGHDDNDDDDNDFMTVPGDEFSAKVTPSNRRVTKMRRADGSKYARTDYSNGTSVETRVTKKK